MQRVEWVTFTDVFTSLTQCVSYVCICIIYRVWQLHVQYKLANILCLPVLLSPREIIQYELDGEISKEREVITYVSAE